MKSALVTGDAGFIGRHMVAALLERGYQVLGIDIKHVNVDLDIRKGSYFHSTIDAREFFATSNQRPFDLVVHCAALVGGRQMIEGQPLSLAVDLEIDAAMFQWAVRTRQPRVVYYSSSAAYPTHVQNGNPPQLSHERHIALDRGAKWIGVPDMSYGWVKVTGEYLASLAEEQGVRVHVFRPFSGYGEDQDFDYPFPSFIKRAAERADPFEIWGDGTQMRDWIHVSDVIEATLAHVEADVKGPVNLCTGTGTSFRELQRMVCDIAGYKPQVELHPAKPSGVPYRVGSAAKMLETYTPQISLAEGITHALEYYERTYRG